MKTDQPSVVSIGFTGGSPRKYKLPIEEHELQQAMWLALAYRAPEGGLDQGPFLSRNHPWDFSEA